MASSLLAGVSGLRAHQQLLDVVGNNLANINTVGFKAQRLRFADLLSETKKAATGAVSGLIGGTNPIQVGLGVKTAAIDTDLKQGSLEATGNDLDLAIQGDGYFVVHDGIRDLYTRAGAFGVDADNVLVDPATGFRVQRYGTVGEGNAAAPAFQVPGDSSIRIPFGTSIPGNATGQITFKGNLSASAVGPLAETLTSTQPLLAAGLPASVATLLNDLDSNTVDYVAGDIIQFVGTDADGSAVSGSFVAGPASTMADLLAALNAAYSLATASLDSSGNLVLQANSTGPANLSLTLSDDVANVGATNFANHSMLLTADGKDGDTVTTAIEVFDTQGTSHNLTLTFQKQGANLWDLTAAIDPAEGTILDGSVQGIQFNDDGSFRQATGTGIGDADIQFQIAGLSTPQTVNFSFGSTNGFDGLTQYGGPTSAAATEQDGFAAGFLIAISVAPDGVIDGVFTNGRTLPIAQIAIASFTNPGGLSREGDNFFSLSNNSGLPLLGTALSGGRGSVQSGTLESSNVDVALEFTRLITAQRGFQVNARTITATDEVLQELSNIIR
jgi:flagellar hook protein FlgE